ncbi:RluA family pseudouridine synthase [Enterobacteriaceae endosymbiont of Donacia cincticornis]|uniref:RluA family pseudouridine synthase n=1 Tax=Enterobacteriaceae endosymbiont of Donacia cincticornis TaxID=2675773 RepID=UPI002484436A|nr:RluA family pseudouridine synthase [Enterobacteriaceae endosymbiont of Donacia cincticornis]
MQINTLILNKKIIWKAQNIPLNIIYEDQYILVINKKSNIVVHPNNKNINSTIFNSILYHYPYSRDIPRAGIIHRLDKNTTGLMIIAKNIYSYFFLRQELKKHNIVRNYEAIVNGIIKHNNVIDYPIKRIYKKNNICMHVHPLGKTAITKIFIKNIFKNYTHLKIKLKTGRTHQIRVHLSYIKHSIVGDQIYRNYTSNINYHKFYKIKINEIIKRQALHAKCIKFVHPFYNTLITLETILPNDINNLINFLKNVSI